MFTPQDLSLPASLKPPLWKPLHCFTQSSLILQLAHRSIISQVYYHSSSVARWAGERMPISCHDLSKFTLRMWSSATGPGLKGRDLLCSLCVLKPCLMYKSTSPGLATACLPGTSWRVQDGHYEGGAMSCGDRWVHLCHLFPLTTSFTWASRKSQSMETF